MTPETPADVALHYVREELSTLRATMHDELAAVRADISELAATLRGHMNDLGPRIAVLEHRIGESEKDIAEIKSERDSDRSKRWTVWIALLASVLSFVGSLVLNFMGS
ncbi:hypothetical protein MOQ72_29190 [Saccharopolyspora sp. K220]|uniref:hypothetical protein n=1 Tax=Saccharopolyspora soli TaxID=2926618 RepID=UPI001F586A8F|nr:hypothetical protein [Saccharopolyspora soli]MCI2421517.1 hypothetical protein [Saccharopolyspora soli]